MTMVVRDGLQWVAGRTGLAHADANDRTHRALCGALPTSPRYAWPIRDYCRTCLSLEAGRKAERKRAAVV